MALRPKYGPYGTVGPGRGFTWAEVRSTDGVLPTDYTSRIRFARQAVYLNRMRRKIREAHGGATAVERVSISVNSWYRSPAYNKKIGGATNSQHVAARATDINVSVVFRKVAGKPRRRTKLLPPTVVAKYAAQVRAFRNGGIGTYDRAHGYFTHLDHRPNGPARWTNG